MEQESWQMLGRVAAWWVKGVAIPIAASRLHIVPTVSCCMHTAVVLLMFTSGAWVRFAGMQLLMLDCDAR